jgi:site-specific DNA-methyltransferase (adenine-specific)
VAVLELLTIKIQQMTIESTNNNNSTKPAITYSECYVQPFFSFYNADNMAIMKTFNDKEFDLAIVDPPYDYSISETHNILNTKKFKGTQEGRSKSGFKIGNSRVDALEKPSNKEYFDELFRVSKNQIIWGGNYFELPLVTAWLLWDKQNGENTFGDGEMAWTSFRNPLRIVRGQILRTNRIHPTEKPVWLYEWLINKYAKDGFKILDTHLGSGSIAIAIDKANTLDKKNLTFVGIELNPDYFRAAVERFKNHKRQCVLF